MKRILALSVALAAPQLAPAAVAQERHSVSSHLAVTTDFIYRGYSRSGSDPAVQAALSYRHRAGVVLGAQVSSVRFATDARVDNPRRLDVHAFAGYEQALGDNWSASLVVARYAFPDADRRVDFSYNEGIVSFSFRDVISASFAYTPEYFGADLTGRFLELSGAYPLPGDVDLSAGVGQAHFDALGDSTYVYGHLGVGRVFGRVRAELAYYFTDAPSIPSWGEVADDRWALTVSVRLR